jgi:Flp pilus assembly protein TadD
MKESQSETRDRPWWIHACRFLIAVVALILCFRLINIVSYQAISRVLQTTAVIQGNLATSETAVRFTPADPEAHYMRAIILGNLDRLDDATAELHETIRLRPHHYYEWLDLAVTLDRLGDYAGARSALDESIRLAPTFAQPRWQLGNLLYRDGKYDEAFVQLRLGANSNADLIPSMLDLAWAAAGGDVASMEALVQPADPRMHLEMARVLARQGRGLDAARHVKDAGEPRDDTERALASGVTNALIKSGKFADAYAVWAVHHPAADPGHSGFSNGDFNEPILKDDPGFGWQIPVISNLSVSVDPEGPLGGGRSIRLQFGGESDPNSDLIAQLILVEPNRKYAVTFMAKTDELVTGGPPNLLVLDPTNPVKVLGQSKPLSVGKNDWTAYRAEFASDANLSAVIVVARRLPCSEKACPIFGTLWLGKFALTKL